MEELNINSPLVQSKVDKTLLSYFQVRFPNREVSELEQSLQGDIGHWLVILHDEESGNWAKLTILEKIEERIIALQESRGMF